MFFLLALLTLSYSQAADKTFTIGTDSKASFLAVGKPSLLKIRGEGAKPSGSIAVKGETVAAEVSIKLDDFVTGIATRDKHMKEKYLETGKPGNANATVKITELSPSCLLESKKCDFKGDLSLHGQTKPIKNGKIVTEVTGASTRVVADFPVELTEFGISVPSFAGVTVANEVTVRVEVVLQ